VHILPVAGVHEIHALAEGLVVIKNRPAQVIRHEPGFRLGPFRKECFIGDSAADVNPQLHAVLLDQPDQFKRLLLVLAFRLQAVTFVEVRHHHGHAQLFELPDRFLAVLLVLILVFLPGGVAAHPASKNWHAVVIRDKHDGHLVQPGRPGSRFGLLRRDGERP